MTLRKIMWFMVPGLAFLIILAVGCSDKTFTATVISVSEDASPSTFLPIEQGLRINYAVLEPSSQYFSIEVTDPVSVFGHPGFKIRKVNTTTGETTITYRYEVDNAIFESGSVTEPGVRILDGPFVIGHSWDRYDTTTTSTDEPGTGDTGDDTGDSGDLDLNSVPGDTYTTMSVVGMENVQSLEGFTYGNCLKIAWQSSEDSWNYYWYAAGIGLVKYETNYSSLSTSTTHTVGLMTSYQTIEY